MSDLKKDIEDLSNSIDEVLSRPTEDIIGSDLAKQELRLSLMASRMLLNTLSSTLMGECRKKKPYEPLRPIIDEKGVFKWCCTHTPPHCSDD